MNFASVGKAAAVEIAERIDASPKIVLNLCQSVEESANEISLDQPAAAEYPSLKDSSEPDSLTATFPTEPVKSPPRILSEPPKRSITSSPEPIIANEPVILTLPAKSTKPPCSPRPMYSALPPTYNVSTPASKIAATVAVDVMSAMPPSPLTAMSPDTRTDELTSKRLSV